MAVSYANFVATNPARDASKNQEQAISTKYDETKQSLMHFVSY